MDPVWKNLPYDLVRHIFSLADLNIDTRLAFGIRPKKLEEAKCWKFWYRLKSHDGVVYNLDTKTLHNFNPIGVHTVRRPIDLDYHTAGLVIFNSAEEEYMEEKNYPCGSFLGTVSSEPWITDAKILFKRVTDY